MRHPVVIRFAIKESKAKTIFVPKPPEHHLSYYKLNLQGPHIENSSESFIISTVYTLAMYSSYSPGESSSVAVVPSPHSASLSPFYSIRSPPSAFDSGFGCDLLPPKKRICSEQVTKTTNVFSFASDCTARDQFTSQFSTSISPIFSETPAYNFSSAATPADYQFGSIDDVLHQDSKVGLASFLHQDVVAMQTPQQQAQMRSLVAGQVPLNLSTAGTRKEDYSMIIYQEPEEVATTIAVLYM